jgi:hypothetical protein
LRKHKESFDSPDGRNKLTAAIDVVNYQQGNDERQLGANRLRGERALIKQGFTPGDVLWTEAPTAASMVALLATRRGQNPPGELEPDVPPAKPEDLAAETQLFFCHAETKRPTLEKDKKGRIRRINYSDNTYRIVDYNYNNDPCEFVHFSADGKELGRMKLPGGFEPAEKYKIKDDGTIEKTVDIVREKRTNTKYDRTGREIGWESVVFREALFRETFNLDGTHSIERDYPSPDKRTRKLVERGGQPFLYTCSGKDGKQVWTRDEKSNAWYEASDPNRKKPWYGTMQFLADGRFLEMDSNGTLSEVSKDGFRGASDPAKWRADILKVADEKLRTADEKKQFRNDVDDLWVRVGKRELSAEQATAICQEAYRLFCCDSKVGVEKPHMNVLACQVVHQGAHPEDVDQGRWNNCNVSDSDIWLWYQQPELAARIVANQAITGGHTTPGGETVSIAKSLKPADATCLKTPPGDNIRSYATQLLHLTSVNLELIEFNKRHGTKLEYIQGPATEKDNGACLVDNSTHPPSRVYRFDGGTPILRPQKMMNPKGEYLLCADLRPFETTPMEAPGLTIQNTISVLEKLTGKPKNDIGIGHFVNAGQVDNWILDKVGLASDIRRDPRIAFFRDEEGLRKILLDAQRHGRFPLILQADTGSGFLRKQVEEANGAPLGGDGGNFGGPHVICIKSYNDSSRTAEIDGSWGRCRDKLGKDAVTLAEVVEVSKPNEKLMAEQKAYQEDIKAAYEHWCATFGKRKYVDYPEAEEGKAYFKKYRDSKRK